MRYRYAACLIALLPGFFGPSEAYAYREDESEAQVEADIDRGENKFVEKLVQAERSIAHDTKTALKAEEQRDLLILRGQNAVKDAPAVAPQDDHSIAEIEREIDQLGK